jgi:hypothetical protein
MLSKEQTEAAASALLEKERGEKSTLSNLTTAEREKTNYGGNPSLTSAQLKIVAIILLVAALALDIWIPSFRCSASPDVDWSRLAFGFSIQAFVVAAPFLIRHIFPDASRGTNFAVALAAFFLFAFSYGVVRNSTLFGDSIDPSRGPASAGFQCEGARSLFLLGHH